jgi:hypothetical protein
MGLFDKAKEAMAQSGDAMKAAEQAQQNAGGLSGLDGAGITAARGEMETAAHENNRILTVGSPGQATIKSHVDSGEQVAGNAVWILEVEVAPEGGEPYTVQKREIVPTIAMSGYADGSVLPCRIDPADNTKMAFGDKPFM